MPENLVQMRHLSLLAVLAAGIAAVACDKDPNVPEASFALRACPAGNLAANAPITLTFTSAVAPSSVTSANVVVTEAATGREIPGVLGVSPTGTDIVFRPTSPLPFGTAVAIRVQNLLNAAGTSSSGVVFCTALTEPPPIAEVIWNRLTSPTGTNLAGASLYAPDSGWAASLSVPLYRRVGSGWDPRFNQPYFVRSYDVDFVSAVHGWGAHLDQRNGRSVITMSRDGGLVWDTVYSRAGRDVRRLYIDSARTNNRLFGVAGGGSATSAMFLKLDPATGRFATTNEFGATASVSDIDFSLNDSTTGYGVTSGAFFNSTPPIVYPGRLYKTSNGGASWAEVAGAQADTVNVIVYRGVAKRGNGDVWVTGGNGFVRRFIGGATPAPVTNLGIVSRDTSDFNALIYNDVEFAPDNNAVGWIVGAQLIGIVGGVPQYRGLIFATRDGGATWIRQGVVGADEYGAAFPALNRIEVLSASHAWIVGDGGVVLSLTQ